MGIVGWIVLALAIIVVFWAISSYNSLIRGRNEVDSAFGQIDVQLKRRYDLIPNLVEVARKYVQHERETLESVIGARNQASKAREAIHGEPSSVGLDKISALSAAEGVLGSALGRLMMVVEAYPELKADENLRELSEELTSTENRIGFARQAYNDSALEYNNKAEQFPEVIVASLFRFQRIEMLQSTEAPEERKAVKVQF